MNHVLLLITLGVVSASWNPAEEGPSTPGGFGLRSARKLNSGFLDLFSSTEIVPRSAKAEVKKKAEDRSFQVGTVTPTPKSFSEIFTPRAPLVLLKEYENKPFEGTTTKRTQALTTLRALFERVRQEGFNDYEDDSSDYEFEYVYEYVDVQDENKKIFAAKPISGQPSATASKKRPKIVPQQHKSSKSLKKSAKQKKKTTNPPIDTFPEVTESPVSTNYNPITGTLDILYPPIVIQSESLEPASTRRAGYEYPEPENKLLLPGEEITENYLSPTFNSDGKKEPEPVQAPDSYISLGEPANPNIYISVVNSEDNTPTLENPAKVLPPPDTYLSVNPPLEKLPPVPGSETPDVGIKTYSNNEVYNPKARSSTTQRNKGDDEADRPIQEYKSRGGQGDKVSNFSPSNFVTPSAPIGSADFKPSYVSTQYSSASPEINDENYDTPFSAPLPNSSPAPPLPTPPPSSSYQPAPIDSKPSYQPSQQTSQPSYQPSQQTSQPSYQPVQQSSQPSYQPSQQTSQPSYQPVQETSQPSYQPSQQTNYQPIAPPSQPIAPPRSPVKNSVPSSDTIPLTIFLSKPQPAYKSSKRKTTEKPQSIFVTPQPRTTTLPPIIIPPKPSYSPLRPIGLDKKFEQGKVIESPTSSPAVFSTLIPPIQSNPRPPPTPNGFQGLITSSQTKPRQRTSYKNNAPAPYVSLSQDVSDDAEKYNSIRLSEENDEYGNPSGDVITDFDGISPRIVDQTTTFSQIFSRDESSTLTNQQPEILSTEEQFHRYTAPGGGRTETYLSPVPGGNTETYSSPVFESTETYSAPVAKNTDTYSAPVVQNTETYSAPVGENTETYFSSQQTTFSSGEPDSYGSPRASVLTTIQTDTTVKPGYTPYTSTVLEDLQPVYNGHKGGDDIKIDINVSVNNRTKTIKFDSRNPSIFEANQGEGPVILDGSTFNGAGGYDNLGKDQTNPTTYRGETPTFSSTSSEDSSDSYDSFNSYEDGKDSSLYSGPQSDNPVIVDYTDDTEHPTVRYPETSEISYSSSSEPHHPSSRRPPHALEDYNEPIHPLPDYSEPPPRDVKNHVKLDYAAPDLNVEIYEDDYVAPDLEGFTADKYLKSTPSSDVPKLSTHPPINDIYEEPIQTYPTFDDLPLDEDVIDRPILKPKKKKKKKHQTKTRMMKPDLVFLNDEDDQYPDKEVYDPEPYVEDEPYLKPFHEESPYHAPYFQEDIYHQSSKQNNPKQIIKPQDYKPFEEHYKPYKKPNYDKPRFDYKDQIHDEPNPYPEEFPYYETYPEHDNKPEPEPYYLGNIYKPEPYPKHVYKPEPEPYHPEPKPYHPEPKPYHPEPVYKSEPAPPPYGYRTPKEYYGSKLIPELDPALKDPNWNVKDFSTWKENLENKEYGGTLANLRTKGGYHQNPESNNELHNPGLIKPAGYDPNTDPYNVHYKSRPEHEKYENNYENYYQPYPQDYTQYKPVVYETPKPFDISFEDWLDTSDVEAFGLPSDEVNHYQYAPVSYDHIGHRSLKSHEYYDKPLSNIASSPYQNYRHTQSYENYRPTESYYHLPNSYQYSDHKAQVESPILTHSALDALRTISGTRLSSHQTRQVHIPQHFIQPSHPQAFSSHFIPSSTNQPYSDKYPEYYPDPSSWNSTREERKPEHETLFRETVEEKIPDSSPVLFNSNPVSYVVQPTVDFSVSKPRETNPTGSNPRAPNPTFTAGSNLRAAKPTFTAQSGPRAGKPTFNAQSGPRVNPQRKYQGSDPKRKSPSRSKKFRGSNGSLWSGLSNFAQTIIDKTPSPLDLLSFGSENYREYREHQGLSEDYYSDMDYADSALDFTISEQEPEYLDMDFSESVNHVKMIKSDHEVENTKLKSDPDKPNPSLEEFFHLRELNNGTERDTLNTTDVIRDLGELRNEDSDHQEETMIEIIPVGSQPDFKVLNDEMSSDDLTNPKSSTTQDIQIQTFGELGDRSEKDSNQLSNSRNDDSNQLPNSQIDSSQLSYSLNDSTQLSNSRNNGSKQLPKSQNDSPQLSNSRKDNTQLSNSHNDSSQMFSSQNDSSQLFNDQNDIDQLSNSQNDSSQLSNNQNDIVQLSNSQNDSSQLSNSQFDSTQRSDFLEMRMINKDNKQEGHNIQEAFRNINESSAVNNSNYSKDNDDDTGSNDSYVNAFSALIIPSHSNKSEKYFYSKESDGSNDFSGSDNFSEINHPKPTVALPMNIHKTSSSSLKTMFMYLEYIADNKSVLGSTLYNAAKLFQTKMNENGDN